MLLTAAAGCDSFLLLRRKGTGLLLLLLALFVLTLSTTLILYRIQDHELNNQKSVLIFQPMLELKTTLNNCTTEVVQQQPSA
jgi:hypothetical protein